jgi:hypothetical protein
MREFRMSGSVEGAVGNRRPYSDQRTRTSQIDGFCEPLHGPVYNPCCAERPVQHCAPVALETSAQLVTERYTDDHVSRGFLRDPIYSELYGLNTNFSNKIGG